MMASFLKSTLICVASTALWVAAFSYYGAILDSTNQTQSHLETLQVKLATYKRAETEFQAKADLWERVQAERLSEETSPPDLQNHLKHLGELFKFKSLSVSFQDVDSIFQGKSVDIHQISLKVKSASDRDIFMFLQHLKSDSPGLFHIDHLSLERREDTRDPMVTGNMTLTWVHREEDL